MKPVTITFTIPRDLWIKVVQDDYYFEALMIKVREQLQADRSKYANP